MIHPMRRVLTSGFSFMAQRRMFSPDIVCSEEFLDMPVSSQALYFHLGMRADDDGFVQPRLIIKMVGGNEDDLKVLLVKRFLLACGGGVVVIKHWLIHNMIRLDRYKPTRFQKEKESLKIKENKAYTDDWQPIGNQMAPQVRLGKDRILVGSPTHQPPSKEKNMKNTHDPRKFDTDYEETITEDGDKVDSKFDLEAKEKAKTTADINRIIAEHRELYLDRISSDPTKIPQMSVAGLRKSVKLALKIYQADEIISLMPKFFRSKFFENSGYALWTMVSTKVLNNLKHGQDD